MIRAYFSKLLVYSALCFTALSSQVSADLIDFDEGWWRVGGSVLAGMELGEVKQNGEMMVDTRIQYEFPAFWDHMTLALSGIPFFAVEQNGAPMAFGAGIGLALRIYWTPEKDGFYLIASEHWVMHSEKMTGSSTYWNFMTMLGIGYQWENGWSLSGKVQHLSNGNIGTRNAGNDFLGIGIEKRF